MYVTRRLKRYFKQIFRIIAAEKNFYNFKDGEFTFSVESNLSNF